MEREKPARGLERDTGGEEDEAKARCMKKSKGIEAAADENMDDHMEERGQGPEGEVAGLQEGDCEQKEEAKGRGRKLVSYLDKVLCLNGANNEEDSEDEDWVAQQRREEEEDEMPDEVGKGEDEDPLCPTYVFSRQQHKEDCKKWRNALIIKLMGKKMAPRYLMARLLRLWSLIGTYELIDLDNGHLLIKFKEEKDYVHVLQEGPWIVADHYVIVQRWRPFFNPYDDRVKKMAIWIRIPGFPTEFYTTQHLWRIGNMLGRTLKVDKASLRRVEGMEGEVTQRARFARLCVEVDLRKNFLSRFRFWDFYQEEFIYLNVGYEGLHMICFECGRYGHKKEACDGGRDFAQETPMEKEKDTQDTEMAGASKGEGRKDTGGSKDGMPEEGNAFGPWMVIKRENRRRKAVPATEVSPRTSNPETQRRERQEHVQPKPSKVQSANDTVLVQQSSTAAAANKEGQRTMREFWCY